MFTLIVVFTLAVGIGAAMFSVVNAVLLQQLPFRDPSRVVDLNEVESRNRDRGAIAPANFADWRKQEQTFDAMSAYTPADAEPGRGTSVIFGYGLWQRRFAGEPFTIIGIMGDCATRVDPVTALRGD